MNVKPYRLINRSELAELERFFLEKLLSWNEHHALFALSCELLHPEEFEHFTTPYTLFTEQHQPIALVINPNLSMMAHCLFGDLSDCFQSICERVWIDLLSHLLGAQSLQQQDSGPIDTWFYKGSAALALTLRCANQLQTLFLHPQWVLNALPLYERTDKPIDSLDDALASTRLPLQIELSPVLLRLADITSLRVGDVIKTDHPITAALSLKHHQQIISSVHVGETNSIKSIQITRTS